MTHEREDIQFIRFTAKQLASGLLRTIAAMQGTTAAEQQNWRMDIRNVHFHDASQSQIAFNDVQAIQMYNALTGENLTVPDQASEGYNQHYHTSDFDGGFIGTAAHNHYGPLNGGYAFAVFAPGTAVPQQPFAV